MKLQEGDHHAPPQTPGSIKSSASSGPAPGMKLNEMPSERLMRVHNDMTDVIQAIELLQQENLRIKFKAVGQMQNLCASWFSSTTKMTLKTSFGAWKELLHKKRNLEAVNAAIKHTEKQAKLKNQQSLEEQKAEHDRLLAEYVATHKAEVERIRAAHIGDKEGFAAELEARLRGEHEEIIQGHLDDHSEARKSQSETHRTSIRDAEVKRQSMHEEYDLKHAVQEKEIAALELELKHHQKKLARGVAKLNAMERAMIAVRSAMGTYEVDLKSSTLTSPTAGKDPLNKSMEAAADPENAEQREYMKDALHEILEQVDPRYLGRSNVPLRS
ncbi:unnamed protein product [Amoebophrya sp. A120]|nr:unnamed protein product [Amoebophrya sp. A120]|eukprot:GSA120T00004862001.1